MAATGGRAKAQAAATGALKRGREEPPHVRGQGQSWEDPMPEGQQAAKRSYPTSEVRGSGQEYQIATAQEWPRGAILRPRSRVATRGVTSRRRSISYLTFNFYLHLSTHSLFVSSFNASHTVYINNPVGSSHLFSFLFVNIGRFPVIILFFILAQLLSESLNLYLYVCSLSKMRKF